MADYEGIASNIRDFRAEAKSDLWGVRIGIGGAALFGTMGESVDMRIITIPSVIIMGGIAAYSLIENFRNNTRADRLEEIILTHQLQEEPYIDRELSK